MLIRISILILSIGLLASSCQLDSTCGSKEKFKISSKSFFESYDGKSDNLSKKEKEALNEEFNLLVENCYKKFKDDLTLNEKQKFWKDAVVFHFSNNAKEVTNGLSFDTDNMPELDEYIQTEINSVIKESGKEYVDSFKKIIKDEAPEMIDKLLNELGKFGEELKNILRDIEIDE